MKASKMGVVMILFWVLCIVVHIAIITGIVWIVWHFASKYW